ncbi:Nucleolar protein 56 [Zancudomyces culisetae]|uniref:Nucleolar protein 56 n=1 Tax=Zancudomyces culisetae TaxID=1213189 RepID=A0A1R1PLP6_ZANCU|nr:Nucleolar protein 56 [Zancudomyces culisetae]|eukprot:OMH81898.1 Nucleolar protein 56 [Zancudomyces culisetae]
MSATHVLFETASGYGLFEIVEAEVIGSKLPEVQKAVTDLAKFGRYVKLKSFLPFKNAADALENINMVSEGMCGERLKGFLELNLMGSKKKSNVLGVIDRGLAVSIKGETGISCISNEVSAELIRGIRLHEDKFIKDLKAGDLEKAQLGLGHAYSRAKVKFNVNRSDNMIIQAISLLDQLDKDINTFAMRCREWYSWHFPELAKIVADNVQYVKCCALIKNKAEITSEDIFDDLARIVGDDEAVATNIIEAAKSSMGTDISDIDMLNIEAFASRVVSLAEYRKNLFDYLAGKMNVVAPNLAALIGDTVGARLIAHAGSLTNLSKYPASTLQILGAEKALFRALKTKSNTPKYGIIYNSSFIGKAGSKNKGRISRFLANKASIASRIDCFSEEPNSAFGIALRQQVDDRLGFYETGATPSKNSDVMAKVMSEVASTEAESLPTTTAPASKKRPAESDDIDDSDKKSKKSKKEKKDKKEKKEKSEKKESATTEPAADSEKKSKKKDKSKSDKKSKKDRS